MKFEGKVTVVTGGGSGQGAAICEAFAREAADVAVLDIAGQRAQEVADRIVGIGRKGVAFGLDVADFGAVQDCIRTVYDRFNHIDVLVNAAGYAELVSFKDMTEEIWDRSVAVHLKGTFNTSRAVINGMIGQGWGRIISISSIAGVTGTPRHSQYSAAKAGIIGMTKSVAKEVGPYGVTVNAIAPGVIDTPLVRDVPKEQIQAYLSTTPVRRMGRPEEIAALCLYLASEDAGFITGQVINMNGGAYT